MGWTNKLQMSNQTNGQQLRQGNTEKNNNKQGQLLKQGPDKGKGKNRYKSKPDF